MKVRPGIGHFGGSLKSNVVLGNNGSASGLSLSSILGGSGFLPSGPGAVLDDSFVFEVCSEVCYN